MIGFTTVYCFVMAVITICLSIHNDSFVGGSVSGIYFAVGYAVHFVDEKIEDLKRVIDEKK